MHIHCTINTDILCIGPNNAKIICEILHIKLSFYENLFLHFVVCTN